MLRSEQAKLPWSPGLARGAHEFAQRRDIGSVCANPCRIYRQPEAFGGLHVDACVVEFRQAKPNCWKHSLGPARINGSRRAAPLPGPICDCEELMPIVLVPHRSLPRLGNLRRYSFRCTIYLRGRFPAHELTNMFEAHRARYPVYVTIPVASSIDSRMFQRRYEREIIALD